ncbi:MAG: hypothetical protein M1833_004160 [Piccolia ochrophora]|nr:MAG: hypothetical protein M1833_004160 [Piccolia ochrophora]
MTSMAPTSQAPRASRASGTAGSYGANTGPLIFDKTRIGARRSTPDSEALASSDDDFDKHQQEQPSSTAMPPKPVRRASWLSEVQAIPRRKSSVTAMGGQSPNNSQPGTPSGDPMTWASGPTAPGRSHASATSFSWGNGIWNSDSRKEPPARLTEVLPSPTSVVPPPSSGELESLVSPGFRENSAESTIPFAIPLHPTPKTYRSQSYSVGQLDPESPASLPHQVPSSYLTGRTRPHQPARVQHRPSHPSLLNELSHEGTSLGRVRENEDDDDSTGGSQHGVQLSPDARTIESLARENAMLRHAAASNQMENQRLRNRAASTNTVLSAPPTGQGVTAQTNHRTQRGGLDESDYAIDELDELSELQSIGSRPFSPRRLSEYGGEPEGSFSSFMFPENRKLENLKKGQWQSSLGFGGATEGQQSRRHSFATVPARNGSISSVGEHPLSFEPTEGEAGRRNSTSTEISNGLVDSTNRSAQGESGEYAHFRMHHSVEEEFLAREHLLVRNYALSYFSGMNSTQEHTGYISAAHAASVPQAYMLPSQHVSGRPQSPHVATQRNMFAVPQHLSLAQPRQNQLLCVVTFKCCRADVFYIQEGTGLQVKPGDLVIVEADRGTDLGTVANANVSWNKAKELKEHYAEEHYKWLMMFSKHSSQGGNTNATGSTGSVVNHGTLGSAVGGMGPQGGQQGMQDLNPGEPKPKMVKRLAQNHEIQTLRDKEGNEAKAKRVCQQKVVEHRLQMEILDAEFQMDWKKLTFYYFADAYINFNSLVTELFKVYKTRIWMSAINPASFAGPSAGLQPPSGVGPGALGFGRNSPLSNMQQADAMPYGGVGQYRGFQSMYGQPSDVGQPSNIAKANPLQVPYAYAFQPFGQAQRPHAGLMADYSSMMPHSSGMPPDLGQPDYVGSHMHGQQRMPAGPNVGSDRRSHQIEADNVAQPPTTRRLRSTRGPKNPLDNEAKEEGDKSFAEDESQNLGALNKALAKRQHGREDSTRTFEQAVKAEEEALLRLLAQREEEIEQGEEEFKISFKDMVVDALQPLDKPEEAEGKDDAKSATTTHPFQAQSEALLTVAQHLLTTYSKLADEVRSPGSLSPLGQHWEKDTDEVERVLNLGKKVTEERVKNCLENERRNPIPKEQEWEESQMVMRARKGRARVEIEQGWLKAAASSERGVRRLLKGVPDEEDAE